MLKLLRGREVWVHFLWVTTVPSFPLIKDEGRVEGPTTAARAGHPWAHPFKDSLYEPCQREPLYYVLLPGLHSILSSLKINTHKQTKHFLSSPSLLTWEKGEGWAGCKLDLASVCVLTLGLNTPASRQRLHHRQEAWNQSRGPFVCFPARTSAQESLVLLPHWEREVSVGWFLGNSAAYRGIWFFK